MIPPTLAELAKQHAARRLSRKRRNADLRRWGYDLDGEDGRRYRQLLDAEMYGRRAAGAIQDVVREEMGDGAPERIVVWDLPLDEHAAWIAAGMGEGSWIEYADRLARTERELTEAGYRVVRLRATVEEIAGALVELEQPNTSAGRAAAIGWLEAFSRKEDGGKEDGSTS